MSTNNKFSVDQSSQPQEVSLQKSLGSKSQHNHSQIRNSNTNKMMD